MIVCTTKVTDELLEMGKDLKIKHSVFSPPYKVWGNFFHKKPLLGGKNFLGKFLGNVLHGTNDQIMQGRKFQRPIQVCLTLTCVIDTLFEKLVPQIGDGI